MRQEENRGMGGAPRAGGATALAAQRPGDHLLLRLTRGSDGCRSGSQVSSSRLHQRQGVEGRGPGLDGGRVSDGGVGASCTSRWKIAARDAIPVDGASVLGLPQSDTVV